MNRCVFLDRDGTIIEHVHHLARVSDVQLIADAARALTQFAQMGFRRVVVTNQSVVGRGVISEGELDAIHAEMCRQLGEESASIDEIYHCPHAPEVKDPRVIEHPDRKPGPGMLLRAAEEMNLQLDQCWMIGDTISDMLAGRNAACRGTILVRTGCGKAVEEADSAIDHVVDDLFAASQLLARLES